MMDHPPDNEDIRAELKQDLETAIKVLNNNRPQTACKECIKKQLLIQIDTDALDTSARELGVRAILTSLDSSGNETLELNTDIDPDGRLTVSLAKHVHTVEISFKENLTGRSLSIPCKVLREGKQASQVQVRVVGSSTEHNKFDIKNDFALADSPYLLRMDSSIPGRPDPRYSVDTSKFEIWATTSSKGFPRNGKAFWDEWFKINPDSLSETNKALIRGLDPRTGERMFTINKKGKKVYYDHIAPRVDDTWIKHFPEHKDFKFQTIEHHHVDEGQFAVPLPWELHRGKGNYNIWHNSNEI